jgi:hypothetical protein
VYKEFGKRAAQPETATIGDDDGDEAPMVELAEMLDELRVDDDEDAVRAKRERE